MNLKPASDSLVSSLNALQGYITDTLKELETSNNPTKPEDFTVELQTHFCNFLDAAHSAEKALETVVERTSTQYEMDYNKEFGLATVYNIYDYQKAKIDSMSEDDVIDYLMMNHPAGKGKNK